MKKEQRRTCFTANKMFSITSFQQNGIKETCLMHLRQIPVIDSNHWLYILINQAIDQSVIIFEASRIRSIGNIASWYESGP